MGRTARTAEPAEPVSLDAGSVRRWAAAGLDALSAARAEIDALNVYPLPDGDTGANLLRTWQSLATELATTETGAPDDLAAALAAAARGALYGARGNSGVILCQWVRALADALTGTPADGPALADALAVAAAAAHGAVGDPVEGTILSVATAAGTVTPGPLAAVVTGAVTAARTALAATPEQLPPLAAAGVVDAGGRGLVLLLEALEAVVRGRPLLHVPPPGGAAGVLRSLVAARESGSDRYAYEVQYLLEADTAAVDGVRADLGALGDSLAVVGDGEHWNVHVHVNDVGAALERGIEAGRPYRVTVTRFADQRPVVVPVARAGRAVVAVLEGAGLAALFAAEGAIVVPGPSPSVGELTAALTGAGAGEVVLLPCDGERTALAQQAAAAAREHDPALAVVVVPTASPVQGLAALAVAQPGRSLRDDVVAMAEASGRARVAAVTVATQEALTMAGRCLPGDVLGIVDRDVVLLAGDLAEVARGLLDRMLAAGGELVTVVTGAGLDPGVTAAVTAHLAAGHPFVETSVYAGGQPTALLLGVE